ncbi:MAG: MFS transporter [Acidimicrobiia bacterium]
MTGTTSTSTPTRRWLGLAALSMPVLVLSVDMNGVVVLLPQIGHDLGVSAATAGAIVTVASLAFAAPLLLVGRVADRVGPRPLLLSGVVGFAVASFLCAISTNFAVMMAGRSLQGVASACCFTTSLAAIDALFERDRQPIAVGIWGALGGIGGAVGPLVASVLAEVWSWRFFFGVNVALLGIAFVMLVVLVPALPRDGTRDIPWLRLVLVLLGTAGIVGGIQHASSAGWGAAGTLVPIVAGAGFLVGVYLLRSATDPLVTRKVTSLLTFRFGTAEATLSNWGSGVVMVLVPTALEVVRGTTVLEAGMLFLGFSVPFALGGLLSGPMIRRWHGHVVLGLGSAVMVVGIVALAIWGVEASLATVVVGLAIAGLGNGVVYAGATSVALIDVPAGDASEASALLSMLRVLGLALAVAVSTSISATVAQHSSAADGLQVVLVIAAVVTGVGVLLALRHQWSAPRREVHHDPDRAHR